MLRERVERQTLASIQRYAVYQASGRYEINGDEPTVEAALRFFDEQLEAEPEVTGMTAEDVEYLTLLGLNA